MQTKVDRATNRNNNDHRIVAGLKRNEIRMRFDPIRLESTVVDNPYKLESARGWLRLEPAAGPLRSLWFSQRNYKFIPYPFYGETRGSA